VKETQCSSETFVLKGPLTWGYFVIV